VKSLSVFAALVSVLVVSPLFLGAARAADVNQTLVASGFQFHQGTASGTIGPTITANAGDTFRLRIENVDDADHTFTVPHFGVDQTLAAGSASNPTVIFVNITTSSADVGIWQFHCIPHSSGADEARSGMVGNLRVQAATPPPPTPGFEALAAIGALAVAFAVVAVRHRQKA
jgi:plastocyanin